MKTSTHEPAVINHLQENLYRILEEVYRMDENDTRDSYRQLVKEKLEQSHPSLMLYGVYNAGKSSLLNAILGESRAKVGDVPETREVTTYDWKDYQLVDTPGINGPLLDEVIAKEEIQKHDLILFVIDDSDSFDDALVASEIFRICELGKPLLIVLNHKQEFDLEQSMHIQTILRNNVEKIAKERGSVLKDRPYLFTYVHAKSGLKAKNEQKDLLLKNSRLPELERLLFEELRKNEGLRKLNTPIDLLRKKIEHLQSVLQESIDDEAVLDYEQQTDSIENEKRYRMNNSRRRLEKELSTLNNTILLNMETDEIDEQKLTTLYQEGLGRIMESLYEELDQQLNLFLTVQLKLPQHEIDTMQLQNTHQSNDGEALLDSVQGMATTALAASKLVIPKLPVPPVVILNIIVEGIRIWMKASKEKKERERLEQEVEQRQEIAQELVRQKKIMSDTIKLQLEQMQVRVLDEVLPQIQEAIDKYFEQAMRESTENFKMRDDQNHEIQERLQVLKQANHNLSSVELLIQ